MNSTCLQNGAADAAMDAFNGVTDETEIPSKYLSIFIDEAGIAIDSFIDTLITGESSDDNTASEILLITSHKIKGSAASLGLNRPAKLAHLMEDVFQELRENNAPLTLVLTDAMLECGDGLRSYVAGLKSGKPEPDNFSALAAQLLVAAESGVADSTEPAVAAAAIEEAASPPSAVRPAFEFDEAMLASLREQVADWQTAYFGYVDFQPELPLVGLKAQLIHEKLSQQGQVLHFTPPLEGIEEVENLDRAAFALITDDSAESLQTKIAVGGIRRIVVENLAAAAGQAEGGKADALPSTAGGQTATPAAGRKTKALAAAPKAAQRPNETLRVDIERLDQLMNLAGQLVISKARFTQIGERLKDNLTGKHIEQQLDETAGLAAKMVRETAGVGKDAQGAMGMESMRLHVRRMQANLEAIRYDLAHVADFRNGVNDLSEAVHQLGRISDGIQKGVMDTRMVQIGPLFGRFKRVVRDITRNADKEVRLCIRGETTELDKRMIDELGDPLIHMIRNSADHGIELPKERVAAGKAAQGTITLDAHHQGNCIIIQVKDDGRGINDRALLAKAVEKGITTHEEASCWSRQRVLQLVWEPGLTTAKKVTQVSGRGMGMDIVRQKIEEINGMVDVDSHEGIGTTFTIRLPLTLAILPSLMARIEGDVFAMPIESVEEIVNVRTSDIQTVQGLPSTRVRGRVVSIVYLSDIFTWSAGTERPETTVENQPVVVISDQGREIGLAVDSLLGEADIVIKSMAENYQDVPGVAGASILGDGTVSLILDVAAVIGMASGRNVTEATAV